MSISTWRSHHRQSFISKTGQVEADEDSKWPSSGDSMKTFDRNST